MTDLSTRLYKFNVVPPCFAMRNSTAHACKFRISSMHYDLLVNIKSSNRSLTRDMENNLISAI